jgi:hypothetical protein
MGAAGVAPGFRTTEGMMDEPEKIAVLRRSFAALNVREFHRLVAYKRSGKEFACGSHAGCFDCGGRL